MSSLHFLAHSQLHEVLFAFLHTKDVLLYRQIHSKCDEVVVSHAKTSIQDAVGQDLSDQAVEQESMRMWIWMAAVSEAESSRQGHSKVTPMRQLDASLLKLLVLRGDDIGEILSKSPGGVRCLSSKFIRKPSKSVSKAIGTLCGAMTMETVRTLVHVDVSNVDNGDVSDTFIHLVATRSAQLQYLDSSGFRSRKFRRDDVLALIAANCRQLHHLNLAGGDGGGPSLFAGKFFTDEGIKLIAANCHQLRVFNINDTSVVTDDAMKVVATNCPQLQVVDIGSTRNISDTSMKLLAMNCQHLQSLDLSVHSGELITDETIEQVAITCPQLLSLNVRSVAITNVSIKLIATKCRHLRALDVGGTRNITDEAIEAVATYCQELQSLDVSMTMGRITDVSIKLVAKNCKELRFLKMIATSGKITLASIALFPEKISVFPDPRRK